MYLQEGVEQRIKFPLIITTLAGFSDADIGPHAGRAEVAASEHDS